MINTKIPYLKYLFQSVALLLILGGTIQADNSTITKDEVLKVLTDKEFKIRQQGDSECFRVFESVKLSGSTQFSKTSLKKIVEKIKELQAQSPVAILDVREEMHLLGDNELSEIIAEKDWSELHHKLEVINEDENKLVQPGLIEQEQTIAKNLNLQYVRVPVTDDKIPHDNVVDLFLEFYKEQMKNHPNTWFHAHCEHGHGRTTTFMALIHILNTKGEKKLADILKEQHKAGGADLHFSSDIKVDPKDLELKRMRFAFLEKFHEYVNDKDRGFFAKNSWSEWKKIVDE
jgi:protein-tyrosine phosphatase